MSNAHSNFKRCAPENGSRAWTSLTPVFYLQTCLISHQLPRISQWRYKNLVLTWSQIFFLELAWLCYAVRSAQMSFKFYVLVMNYVLNFMNYWLDSCALYSMVLTGLRKRKKRCQPVAYHHHGFVILKRLSSSFWTLLVPSFICQAKHLANKKRRCRVQQLTSIQC